MMGIYRDENGWIALTERQAQGSKSKSTTRIRIGCLETWVEAVHGRDAYKGDILKKRIIHAMYTLMVYVRIVVRPKHAQQAAQAMRLAKKKHAKWRVCAHLMRVYKDQKQSSLLEERANARRGLICANTRNVGRLAPKGGVTYDETRRNKPRIREDEMYRTHRWPRRDKCGPTLAKLLHYIWGIT